MQVYPLSPAEEAELKQTRPFPPCRAACPVNTDVQGYLALIARGQYLEAFELIRAVNPLPSVCSQICHHPCEAECRREAVDEPLAVRPLKRFVTDKVREERKTIEREKAPPRAERIAVIGGGPAGLAAANDLALRGFKVTVFEKQSVLGGQPGLSIPVYRLPRDILQDDVDEILRLGVEAKTNFEIGKDGTLADIAEEYDAVVLAIGLSLSRSLPLPNVDADGVQLALPFLTAANMKELTEISGKVVVVGGGNVAIDVARTAMRLGATEVEMVCLESESEMPAWEWEVEEAVEESIKITHRKGPKSVVVDNGHVRALEVKDVVSVFDSNGRFNPEYNEKAVSEIAGDHIIIAIGQMSDASFVNGTKVKTDERGRLEWNSDTLQTTDPRVFACGEVVTGPGAAIEAIGSAHRAANAVEIYLSDGDFSTLQTPEHEVISSLPETVQEKITGQSREQLKMLDPAVRCRNFEHIEIGYDEATALREARRCRSCGAGAIVDPDHCVACLSCVRLCPYDAPLIRNEAAEMPPEVCQACGLCAGVCPGLAIDMVGFDREQIRTAIDAALNTVKSNGAPKLLAMLCAHHVTQDTLDLPDNVAAVPLQCTNWIDVKDILHGFERGADGVYVVACADAPASDSRDECKYLAEGGQLRIAKRVLRAGMLLEQAGLGKDRLALFRAGNKPQTQWSDFARQMTEKIEALGKSPVAV